MTGDRRRPPSAVRARCGVALLAVALLIAACGPGATNGAGATNAPSAAAGAPSSPALGGITVTSTAFPDGGRLPSRFTCDGPGTAPPLAWSGVPRAARSVAIVVSDPDAPGGTYTHWVVGGLAAGLASLPAPSGRGAALPAGAAQAVNSAGRVGYDPPCPPSGTHHYRFTVSALDVASPFVGGAPTTTALAAVDRHTIARGTLVALYSRG